MPARPPTDKTLGASFAKLARAELSAREAASWDSELLRDPRLLVPVDVQALFVAQGDQIEHADVASDMLGKIDRAAVTGDGSPSPFTNAPDRPPGVYLHWALPDGLTSGHADEGGEVTLPALPNRWLVIRIDEGDNDAKKRKLVGWVVESESARVDKLQGWKEGEGKPETGLSPSDLTAAVGGDFAWTAVFDSAENRFAMYDDLKAPPPKGTVLSYLVVGWHSDPATDPLDPRASDLSFDEVLRSLGWTVDEARFEAARAEARRRREAVVSGTGQEAAPLSVAGVDTTLRIDGRRIKVPATEAAAALIESAETAELKAGP